MKGIIRAGTKAVATSTFGIKIDMIKPYETPYQYAKI